MKRLLLAATAALHIGCGFDSPDSGPSDLKKEDLVGCWQLRDIPCVSKCFDQGGGFYEISKIAGIVAEDSGSYVLRGYALTTASRGQSSGGQLYSDTLTFYYQLQYGHLISMDSRGTPSGSTWSRQSPQSFPCELKPWQFFRKPADWTLF